MGATRYIEPEYFLRSDAIEYGLRSSILDETSGKLITWQIPTVTEQLETENGDSFVQVGRIRPQRPPG